MAIKQLVDKANAPARSARVQKNRGAPETIQPTHVIKQDRQV